MNEETGSATVLLVGVLLVRLAATDVYARYVRVEMGPWLFAAGCLLALAGLAGVLRTLLRPHETVALTEGHEGHTERIGWLLLAPVVALLMVSPPALGSFSVDRSTIAIDSGGMTFDPLPSGATLPMSLLEFDQRAADNAGASFGETPVELTGFVANTADGGGFLIARYQIACCAADAVAAVARVVGVVTTPGRDEWVTVVGTFRGLTDGVPEISASSLRVIPAPLDPYE